MRKASDALRSLIATASCTCIPGTRICDLHGLQDEFFYYNGSLSTTEERMHSCTYAEYVFKSCTAVNNRPFCRFLYAACTQLEYFFGPLCTRAQQKECTSKSEFLLVSFFFKETDISERECTLHVVQL